MSITESELERISFLQENIKFLNDLLHQADTHVLHMSVQKNDVIESLKVVNNISLLGVKIILQSRIIELDDELREYVK